QAEGGVCGRAGEAAGLTLGATDDVDGVLCSGADRGRPPAELVPCGDQLGGLPHIPGGVIGVGVAGDERQRLVGGRPVEGGLPELVVGVRLGLGAFGGQEVDDGDRDVGAEVGVDGDPRQATCGVPGAGVDHLDVAVAGHPSPTCVHDDPVAVAVDVDPPAAAVGGVLDDAGQVAGVGAGLGAGQDPLTRRGRLDDDGGRDV